MIKTLVIDTNSKPTLNQLEKIDLIKVIDCFEDFSKINVELSEIDLIIFEINKNNSKEVISYITNLINTKPKLKFIAISAQMNSSIIEELSKININEFILKPVLLNLLKASIDNIMCSKQEANVISIFSSKNATGRTSLCTNLAYLTSIKTNKKTCIIDLNNSQDVFSYLGLKEKCDFETILLNIETSNDENIHKYTIQYKNTNLYVLNCNKEYSFSKINSSEIIKIIASIKKYFEYIYIDMDNVFDEKKLAILNSSDLILYLNLLNPKYIENIQKTYELFDNIGYSHDKIKLLINRYDKTLESCIKTLENNLNIEVFSKIPNNYLTIIDAINRGLLVEQTNPQSNIARIYREIVDKILQIDFQYLKTLKTNNNGIFNLLRRMGE